MPRAKYPKPVLPDHEAWLRWREKHMTVCADYPNGKCNKHRHTDRKRMLLLDAGEGFAYVCYSKALANGLISRDWGVVKPCKT